MLEQHAWNREGIGTGSIRFGHTPVQNPMDDVEVGLHGALRMGSSGVVLLAVDVHPGFATRPRGLGCNTTGAFTQRRGLEPSVGSGPEC